MKISDAIARIQSGNDLVDEEMRSVMTQIMSGSATPAQIGALLMGLSMKGETVTEVAAAADVMRTLAVPVDLGITNAVDIVGTGGDAAHTFNVSTAASLVVAGAGVPVAKHGNRSVSSSSGAADVLEAAGVNLDLNPEQIAELIQQVGFGFMFAPRHHSAMRHAVLPRREMGVRTLFNILGPLTNPAGVRHHLIGVYHLRWLEPLAEVLGRLGSSHALVVHSAEGLDELSISAPTEVAEWKHGTIHRYTLHPEDFDLDLAGLDTLRVASATESLEVIRGLLEGREGPARDMVLLNAGAALYAADAVENIADGIQRSRDVISDGSGLQKLNQLVEVSQQLGVTNS